MARALQGPRASVGPAPRPETVYQIRESERGPRTWDGNRNERNILMLAELMLITNLAFNVCYDTEKMVPDWVQYDLGPHEAVRMKLRRK